MDTIKWIPSSCHLKARVYACQRAPGGQVPPQFETPMPKLQPAVFPPSLNEPPAPSLDLFDLDEHFASERVRLAQLTNKCGDGDLESAGRIHCDDHRRARSRDQQKSSWCYEKCFKLIVAEATFTSRSRKSKGFLPQ